MNTCLRHRSRRQQHPPIIIASSSSSSSSSSGDDGRRIRIVFNLPSSSPRPRRGILLLPLLATVIAAAAVIAAARPSSAAAVASSAAGATTTTTTTTAVRRRSSSLLDIIPFPGSVDACSSAMTKTTAIAARRGNELLASSSLPPRGGGGGLGGLRRALFPIDSSEMTKFLLIGSIKFFVVMALTLTRDGKDAMVVAECGAEAIAFLKVSVDGMGWDGSMRTAPHRTPTPACEDVELERERERGRERERERRGNVGVVPIANPKNLPVWKETLVKVTSVCSCILMGLVTLKLTSCLWHLLVGPQSRLSSQSYSRQALHRAWNVTLGLIVCECAI